MIRDHLGDGAPGLAARTERSLASVHEASAGDIATLAKQVSSSVSAVQSFYDASKSKCS